MPQQRGRALYGRAARLLRRRLLLPGRDHRPDPGHHDLPQAGDWAVRQIIGQDQGGPRAPRQQGRQAAGHAKPRDQEPAAAGFAGGPGDAVRKGVTLRSNTKK